MATNEELLAKEIWDMFAEPTPPKRAAWISAVQTGNMPGMAAGSDAIVKFSDFNQHHLKKAGALADHWIALEQKSPGIAGVQSVVDAYRALEGHENPDLLLYALTSYVTLRPQDGFPLQVPSILITDPDKIAPSHQEDRDGALGVAVGSAMETKMDWFREDPLLNEHHAHWHQVYRGDVIKDRQGEMFFYMHQQMLARYDTERMGQEVPAVVPFKDFSNAVAVGYAAGPDVRLSNAYTPRAPNQHANDDFAANQPDILSEAMSDIASGMYDMNASTSEINKRETEAINVLGGIIEPSAAAGANQPSYYGYHGGGHMSISAINSNANAAGVMSNTVTAIRDVIFWEWHKGVDEIGQAWQDRSPVQDLATDAPPVKMRKSVDAHGKAYSADIIVCKSSTIAGIDAAGFNGDAFGETNFGGAQWNTDFASGINGAVSTADVLNTKMASGTITVSPAKAYTYPYLTHDPFCFFIRVENTSVRTLHVTVRIFIVLEQYENERRKWIELDKFLHDLKPNSKSVIFRRDRQSSVIRKPAVTDPSTHNTHFNPDDINESDCTCGWPYHLLLPRGNKTGMPFRLMVMITDAAIDLVGPEPDCGSLSFCGARTSDYPDKRPLGYPFNRKFDAAHPISATIASMDNMASRLITIKEL